MHHSPVMQYLLAHGRAFRTACAELIRNPMSNVVTTLMIGIIIALPLCLFAVLQNIQQLNKASQMTSPAVSLYLKENTSAAAAETVLKTVKNNPAIDDAVYISPEAGLADFQKNTPFSDIKYLFNSNPIPAVIIAYPNTDNRSPAAMHSLFETLKILPNVDLAQLDLDWAARLYDMLMLGHQLTTLLFVLFGTGIGFIIGHALNTQLTRHLQEIRLLRLIGASNMFIRRPLLHSGILYGVLGGAAAWLIVKCLVSILQPTVSTLAKSYNSTFQLIALTPEQGVLLLLGAGVLGFLSAFILSCYFLRLPESE